MGTILKEKEAYSWLSLVYCKPMSFFFLINYSLSKQYGLHNLLKAYLPLFFRTFFISSFSDCHLSTWLVNLLFIFFVPQLYHFQIVICQSDLSIFCSFFSSHNCTILKNSPFSSINLHKVTQTLRDQSIFKQIKQELRFHIVLLFYS